MRQHWLRQAGSKHCLHMWKEDHTSTLPVLQSQFSLAVCIVKCKHHSVLAAWPALTLAEVKLIVTASSRHYFRPSHSATFDLHMQGCLTEVKGYRWRRQGLQVKKGEWCPTITSVKWQDSYLHLPNQPNSSGLASMNLKAGLLLLNQVKNSALQKGILFTWLWTTQVFSVCRRLLQREGSSVLKPSSVLFSHWFYSH